MTGPNRLLAGAALSLSLVTPAIGQDAPACAPGQRLFEHELIDGGPVCVPESPGRVAFLDSNVVVGIELGIPSVTRSYYSDVIVADFPGVAAKLDPATTTHVGNTWEMNGEVLLQADPDLVIDAIYWEDANTLAKAIAPTVVIDEDRTSGIWDVSRLVAALFGKEAEQAELEADVDARVAGFRAALEASPAGRTFSFSQVESPTQLWMFTVEAFGPDFALRSGMELGAGVLSPEEAAQRADGSTVAFPVSQENLAEIDADHIFLYANLGSDPEAMLKDNEIFQRFAAARPGQIHFIKGEYWFRGSAMSAHRIIDDLYRDVLGIDPETVSPNPFRWAYEVAATP